MWTMLGSPRQACDGITRRETLKVGALSLLGSGFTLPNLLKAEQSRSVNSRPGKAKSVILLYLLGGAATQDMWDLKPDAPVGIKSEFKPIATNVTGIKISDQLPLMSRWMNKAAVIRSVNHKAGCHNCLPSYAGYEVPQPDQHPRDTNPPSMGSVCEFLKDRESEFPDYIYMPCWLGWGQSFRRAGPYAGFLGKRFDPLMTQCKPFGEKGVVAAPGKGGIVYGMPELEATELPADMTIDRLNSRHTLMRQFDDRMRKIESIPAQSFERHQQRSMSLLTSSAVRAAFDLSKEDSRLLDRYDRTLFGHSTLIARRMVEAGVRFVNVTWDLFFGPVNVDYDAWDTHSNNYPILKQKLPRLDKTFDALMSDLSARNLLDETLVVIMSEMGRTPRVNGNGGRDHWTFCYSVMMAGAGIKGGSVYGASDAQAAYVKDNPVSTSDICATIYSCLGIDPDTTVPDRTGRPVPISNGGVPIREILA
ncbi:MAG: DUF1501 domain-containing protein [Planctomycetes bacterium]|nr:DUF1501 domain-containing protein [Planctomycetota bacterium]